MAVGCQGKNSGKRVATGGAVGNPWRMALAGRGRPGLDAPVGGAGFFPVVSRGGVGLDRVVEVTMGPTGPAIGSSESLQVRWLSRPARLTSIPLLPVLRAPAAAA